MHLILLDPVVVNAPVADSESLLLIIAFAALVILGIIFFIFRKKFKK